MDSIKCIAQNLALWDKFSVLRWYPMKPNFLFIGPDKTGSSWMYEILRQHPNCYVPLCKDIYFFDRHYERGLDWYFELFQEANKTHTAIGELSHNYLFSPAAAIRILKDLPDVKLIMCLRHPVERIFSHYLYMIRSGRTQSSFEHALGNYPELLNNSLYYRHLKEYFQRFSRDKIKILFFQDLKLDSTQFAKHLFEFIDLPFVPELPYEKVVLATSLPRNFALAFLAKQGASVARDWGLVNLVGTIKRSALTKVLYKPLTPQERPVIAADTVAELLEIFRDDTLALQNLLETDLSDWLTFKR
jgi:hypothetical protein